MENVGGDSSVASWSSALCTPHWTVVAVLLLLATAVKLDREMTTASQACGEIR
jgi:hypothetical protein